MFSDSTNFEALSAGLDHDAVMSITPELIQWAEIIFVMENAQRDRLRKRFRKYINKQRVICLDIPDNYAYMDPELVQLLEAKVPRHV